MPDLHIGDRLPDNFFDKVMDKRKSVPHIRTCKDCGYKYPTVEIVLTRSWDGKRADCCPTHYMVGSHVVTQVTPYRFLKGGYYSPALLLVAQLGGVYRRRVCRVTTGLDGGEPHPCGIRWTTGEFDPAGTVTQDISKCPKCGGQKTKIELKKRSKRNLTTEK